MCGAVWPDHGAAKAEPAIDRADVQQFQQHAIRVAVHNPFDGTEPEIAGGIGHFARLLGEFGQIRNELTGNRIVWIVAVDQFRDRSGDADRVGCGELFYRFFAGGREKTGVHEVRGIAQKCRSAGHGSMIPRCTGVQITCSMWDAPVASITRRSKPSAIPHAGGMIAKACKKSSSSG